MAEFRARISRVRPKVGGADISVLPTPLNEQGENTRGELIKSAKRIASYEGELDGYVVIGLYADGARSCGYSVSKRIPREMLPSYVAEILRTDACTANEFHNQFEWSEQ